MYIAISLIEEVKNIRVVTSVGETVTNLLQRNVPGSFLEIRFGTLVVLGTQDLETMILDLYRSEVLDDRKGANLAENLG